MAKRKTYDWEAIEAEYRAGQLSIKAIARKHGCSDGTIRYRAKQNGWTRDLTKKVQDEVKKELLRDPLRGETRGSEKQIIEEAGKRGADVVRFHRKGISNALQGLETLTVALDSAIDRQRSLETALDAEKELDNGDTAPDLGAYLNNLSKSTSIAVQLSLAWKNYITLERQAYNLDDKDAGEDKNTMIIHDPTRPDMDL